MADTVTRYVAERIIERDRAIEGDWLIKRVMHEEAAKTKDARDTIAAVAAGQLRAVAPDRRALGWVVAAFLLGLLLGVTGLLAYAWVTVPAPV
jgi:hypothetical protein